ncbi:MULTISPECIES: hypothetical protein [unclassified Sinorhizobium]|uniref:hypothetical protein n=1 Tax=unclassified Sinorhizobium TaxID=2613772 RepID=UPI0024C24A5C|nr:MULTISPECIES: hypothetical protein [unclassified Sinorhizobium]MDK1377241.1 hypothetical protein [Sinorhizobium sp. 6-70]MDK1478793.1 hypothetical protein [Sinorhizobium sp. 6-117]
MLGFDEMSKFWHRITYYRHRSELWALGLAMQVPLLAMLPIGIVLGFWWVIAPLPIVLPIILLLESLGHFGAIVLGFLGIPALVVLLLAAPWFFGWYGIAASLMFGRFTTAKAKEKALAESIHAYRTKAV